MKQNSFNSTERFSNRVDNYARYRPDYPAAVLDLLEKQAGLSAGSVIADIGSGTGISAELFLKNGNKVYAVEPNDEMRQFAESQLKKYPGFHSVKGTSGATTLHDNTADFVVAAQAFHWFESEAARIEFTRILKPDGYIVLIWNTRRSDSTGFLRDYESLLEKYGTDYRQVNHRNINEDMLEYFFRTWKKEILFNEQVLDFKGLKGRLLSSSYTPLPGDSRYEPMLEELNRIFRKHNEVGFIRIEYDTEMYYGHIH